MSIASASQALSTSATDSFAAFAAEFAGKAHPDFFSDSALDRLAMAHDASHYLLVPGAVLRPQSAADMGRIFAAADRHGLPLTFRSGGTSLSGQAGTDGLLIDTRRHFRDIEVLDGGARVRVQPGATVQAVNSALAPYGRKLGPDPASISACTIGGVVANNSSGMSSGTEFNTYNTLDSMVFILPSGTVIDTAKSDADAQLAAQEPALHEGLIRLRRQILDNPASVAKIQQQFSMKNTMGYGLNSFMDYELPVKILEHLMIGSEGTLGFVASAIYRTLPVLSHVSTGLLTFSNLIDATNAIPQLVEAGTATAELLDATSIRVAQRTGQVPESLAAIEVVNHATLLVEFWGNSANEIAHRQEQAAPMLAGLPTVLPVRMTSDAAERNLLWAARRGLYTTVAGARPSGTNALLEDVVVPVEKLGATCQNLSELFNAHGYRDSVIFGHAKDGNIHFMLNEQFRDANLLKRYEAFTEDMVHLILDADGSLKAEHGTGRIMAPYVRRQFGDELYRIMCELKALVDPKNVFNPGVVLSDDPASYIQNLKVAEPVEEEVDRCVECGYCEPVCPSKDLTLTPRQRIVIRREIQAAQAEGNTALADQLATEYTYHGVQTCAVDGMCLTRCPVQINTGDLVRRLRSEQQNKVAAKGWDLAAKNWARVDSTAGLALTTAKALPFPLPKAATDIGRKLLGTDFVPSYKKDLPAGGKPRAPQPNPRAEIVFFPACVGAMFGGVDSAGKPAPSATEAFITLCQRAGVQFTVPEGIKSLCCGTPWKSKGYTDGYQHMADRVLDILWAACQGGHLPIVCDASSCTEGLQVMKEKAAKAGPGASGRDYSQLTFIDSVEFAADRLLPALTVTRPIGSVALHPTCSVTHLGIASKFVQVAQAISPDAVVPQAWGCCAYAGDRGMLHPELTASATAAEAAEVNSRTFEAYASTNRTCEQGMTEATGHTYQNILQLLEAATR